MKRALLISTALAFLFVVACATMPKAFNEKLGTGYATVTEVRDLTTSLLENNVITADNAQNVQTQADNFRTGLDIARTMHTQADPGADTKLSSVLTGLTALRDYLRSPK